MILDSKNIKYEIVDISEPGKEEDKDFMHTNSTSKGNVDMIFMDKKRKLRVDKFLKKIPKKLIFN